jgi:L,D-peptidoglycan transpeptidase YkuD (ErfK/YbiS/YcfS/YnhG family)
MSADFIAHADGRFLLAGRQVRCSVGRSGVIAAAEKREGDGASPIGTWPMRRVFYRPDRLNPPKTHLPVVALSQEDGWCDAPEDPLYNRWVKLPYGASHEKLWLEDHVYDVIVELGYNDDPPVPFHGSAIFLHLARPDWGPTAGCVAVTLEDMLEILRLSARGTEIEIRT